MPREVEVTKTKSGGYVATVDGEDADLKMKQIGKVTCIRVDLPNSDNVLGIEGDSVKSKRTNMERLLGSKTGETQKRTSDDPLSPEYNFSGFLQLFEESVYHNRSIKTLRDDIVTKLTIVESKNDLMRLGRNNTERKKQKQILFDWLDIVQEEESLEEILKPVVFDLLGFGNGRLECSRRVNGLPGKVWHIQADTIREVNDYNSKKVHRLVQMIDGSIEKWFIEYGKKFKNGKWFLVNRGDGKGNSKLNQLDAANEILTFKEYHPKDPIYGIPGILAAVRAVKGNLRVRERNLNWFLYPVPGHMIILKGVDVDEGMRTEMEQFFMDVEKGGKSLMILGLPRIANELDINFQSFDDGIKDFQFVEYTLNNRDEILVADGVPHARLGIPAGKARGSGEGLTQTENYKSAVISPYQNFIENVINNKILRQGLGVVFWGLAFKETSVRDQRKICLISSDLVRSGIITQNESRVMNGYERINKKDPNYDENYDRLVPEGSSIPSGTPKGMKETPKERVGDETKSLTDEQRELIKKYANKTFTEDDAERVAKEILEDM